MVCRTPRSRGSPCRDGHFAFGHRAAHFSDLFCRCLWLAHLMAAACTGGGCSDAADGVYCAACARRLWLASRWYFARSSVGGAGRGGKRRLRQLDDSRAGDAHLDFLYVGACVRSLSNFHYGYAATDDSFDDRCWLFTIYCVEYDFARVDSCFSQQACMGDIDRSVQSKEARCYWCCANRWRGVGYCL